MYRCIYIFIYIYTYWDAGMEFHSGWINSSTSNHQFVEHSWWKLESCLPLFGRKCDSFSFKNAHAPTTYI